MRQVIVILLFTLIFSCSKEDRYGNSCTPENPFEMGWFSEWIADLQYCSCRVSIFQADYDGETVFWKLMTDPLCQGKIENITVRCCIGCELLVLETYEDLVEFQKKVSGLKIIYNCPTPRE